MKRRFTILTAALALLAFLAIPMGMWGQVTTATQTSFTAVNGHVNNDSKVAYNSYQGGGTSGPGVYSNAIRLYQNSNGNTGGYLVIGVDSGYEIISATIRSTSATTTGYKLTSTAPSSTPAKNTFNVNDYSLNANTDYTVNNISTQFITFACFGTSSSTRLNVSKISITYQSNGGTPDTYTVTFNPGSGSCNTSELSGSMDASITLPTATPSEACAGYGWTFAGWAKSPVAENSTAPTLYTGSYQISGNETLYAVYSLAEGESDQTVFNFETIAANNNWGDQTIHTTVSIAPITITANGGGINGRYHTSDKTWRIYSSSNGSVTVTSTNSNYDIVAVSSNPSKEFSISNGQATFTAASNTSFKSITVTWGNYTYTYATSPTCVEKVADPTFSEAGGSFYPTKSIELSCETPEATILYKLSENGNWVAYSGAITITSTTTIWAKATKDGMPESNVVSQTYTRLYTITVNQAIGGVVSASPTHAAEGATVTLTATPNVGYTFNNEWSVTPSSITVSGNSFQMPASDVTVSASFVASAAGTYTVSFSINNKIEMTATVDAGNSIDMTKFVADVTTEGYIFSGWYTAATDGTKLPDSYQPSADITVYAQFGEPAADAYTLVTSVEQLVAGSKVVIAADGTKNVGMSTTQGDNNRGVVTLTKNNNIITFDVEAGLCELTLGTSNNHWTFYDGDGIGGANGYLYAASSSNNYLKTQATNDVNGEWTIVVASNGNATITAQGENTRKILRYNSGSSVFSCYGSGQQPVWLYTKPASSKGTRVNVDAKSKVTAIAANVLVTVKNGGVVYLTGTNAGNVSNLVVEDGGQLISTNNVEGTMLKSVTGFVTNNNKGHYYFISSPFTSETSPMNVRYMINTAGYDLYYFDQTRELEWITYKEGGEAYKPGFNLVSGKGYLYANIETKSLEFAGTLRKGVNNNEMNTYTNFNLVYDNNAEFAGWNLVGNPFTSNVTVSKAFYKMNNTSDGVNTTAVVAGGMIAPMEGVFVLAENADDKDVVFAVNPTMPNKSRSVNVNVAREGEFLDRAIVTMGEGRLLNKLYLSENTTTISIPQDGNDYAIVPSNGQNEMPVSFKASRNANYTISIDAENVEMNYLHLIDNMTGVDVDLLQTPSYSFEARTTDYANRFKLVFATGDNSNDDNFAFFSNGSFVINNDGAATLQVIDVTGRIVKSESINGCTNVNVNAASGIYMLRLINGDNVKVQKVVVK